MEHLSLPELLFGLLYISNNLQEELHHSHFYYLLIGSRDFTGISEYRFTAMVALLSLLVLVISASAHLSSEDYSSILITASILILIDIAILPVTTVVSSYSSTEHVEYSH
jgi:hypothetical protein